MELSESWILILDSILEIRNFFLSLSLFRFLSIIA